MAVIRQTAGSTSDRSFSYLYIANVLSALLGTLTSAFVLIELLGFQGTLYVAGSLNAVLALSAFAISFTVVSVPSITKPISGQAPRPGLYGLPRSAILLLLFTTGLVSMGMEVVWIVKKHLRRGGILQTWYPGLDGDKAAGVSLIKALMQSFPYVRAFRSVDNHFGIHLLASMEPISIPSSSILATRMPPAAVSDFVEWGPETTPQEKFDLVLSHEIPFQQLVAEGPRVPAMRDDHPINEYFLLRDLFHFDR
jgi:hypothetical protein